MTSNEHFALEWTYIIRTDEMFSEKAMTHFATALAKAHGVMSSKELSTAQITLRVIGLSAKTSDGQEPK